MAEDYRFRYGESLARPPGAQLPTNGGTPPFSLDVAAPVESRVKFLGHALHQQLIPFPFGLLVTAVIFDVSYLLTDSQELANAAYWMIGAGIIGGLIAAAPGLIDWTAIPKGTRAKRVGALHGLGNVVLLALFVASWWLRRDNLARGACPELVLCRSGPGCCHRLARG
ncbi:MAG TPA: DUF2231 domain-containing protein [Acidimicrobiales bacterium]|nr:DUF2231 domain-containing protein [Acidimicrobiales bacterium]